MSFDLESLVRPNIRDLVPYSSARGEFAGDGRIFLDANENSHGSPLPTDHSRYPDPLQTAIKRKVAEWNSLEPENIFVGNGSDEAIDLLFRIFCRPGVDNVLICPPTYGVYEVAAAVNDVKVKKVLLSPAFELDMPGILDAADRETKLVFICTPNNPTGNSIPRDSILQIARSFDGLVVVDEAYLHFSGERSLTSVLAQYPNIVVLQTLSKAWGLAGLRIGVAFASEGIITLFNKVKAPYNVSDESQRLVLRAFENAGFVTNAVAEIVKERGRLEDELARLQFVEKVYPSDANFLLVRVMKPVEIYRFLLDHQVVVRDRSRVELCEGCLRITVGTSDENSELLEVLTNYEKSSIY